MHSQVESKESCSECATISPVQERQLPVSGEKMCTNTG